MTLPPPSKFVWKFVNFGRDWRPSKSGCLAHGGFPHLTHSVATGLGNLQHPNQLPLEALPLTQELLIVAPSP